MKLTASIPVRGDRIDYSFNTVTGVHRVVFAMSAATCSGNAGQVANALVRFREYTQVDELFCWLCK